MSEEEKKEVLEIVEKLRPLSEIDRKIILNNISLLQIRADIANKDNVDTEKHLERG